MSSVIKRALFQNRLKYLTEVKNRYPEITNPDMIVKRQMERFNQIWGYCYRTLPFYQGWKEFHHLPERIDQISDLKGFPVLTKKVIQENQDRIFQQGRIKKWVSTGGSTGNPTKFPSDPQDALLTYADLYTGRSWWGIQPLDVSLLFWGHSHLFGSGIKGHLKNYKRKLSDFFLNAHRLNAYDMTVDTLKKYYEVYRRSNPAFILGYTSCVYKLAKYIEENQLDQGEKNRLKAVIVTSETVTQNDVALLRKVFSVPVVVEYGMAETGVIGYSYRETWAIKIFWDSFLARIGEDGVFLVSTLSNRFFPLINYDTNDVVTVKRMHESSVLEISSIQGRKSEALKIGTIQRSYLELSGILVVHILKAYPHIFSIQFEQLNSCRIRIHLVADRILDLNEVKRYFMKELGKDYKGVDVDCVEILQAKSLLKTLAGKEGLMCLK
ncbi:MAG: hypothetical protein HYZ66_00410 [Chlamydiae bacterium]|nr:hypothetical protein [Chlamydiota bacterium]